MFIMAIQNLVLNRTRTRTKIVKYNTSIEKYCRLCARRNIYIDHRIKKMKKKMNSLYFWPLFNYYKIFNFLVTVVTYEHSLDLYKIYRKGN